MGPAALSAAVVVRASHPREVAARVDAINTSRVSAGRFAYFRVVSRTQIPRFRRSFRHYGRQTSTSFEDLTTATMYKDLVDVVGPAKALASVGADQHSSRVRANPPPTTTAARKIEVGANCN